MKKIPSLFVRNHDGDKLVRDEVTPGCEWVAAGEGWATRKYDGTSCMVRDGQLFKRYQLNPRRTAPESFEAVTEPDPITGKVVGWVPVGAGPEDQYHREAFTTFVPQSLIDAGYPPATHPLWAEWENGTYELVGPKVQGNVEKIEGQHKLVLHGDTQLFNVPRDYHGLQQYLAQYTMEGVVFYHEDGRRAKIKTRDFGLPWPKTAI